MSTDDAQDRRALASPEMIAAAWDAWKSRHGGRLGPGPAFREAIEAALRHQPASTPSADPKLLRAQLRDALEGERRWALRCGYILDKTEVPPVPAEAGRLAYDTMRTAGVAGTPWPASADRWDTLPTDVKQRWAWVECACIDRARAASADPGTAGRDAGAADGWMPIETAPTNCALQVFCPGLDYYGNDGVYAGMLVDMGTGKRWMTFAWAMGRDMIGDNRPTHWRWLPDPPRALPLGPEHQPETTEGGA